MNPWHTPLYVFCVLVVAAVVAGVIMFAVGSMPPPEPVVVDEWRCIVLDGRGEPVVEDGMVKTAPAPDARCDYWRDRGVVK